jgi:hypothetical protein
MNPEFKNWLSKQKFVYLAYNPKGWKIHKKGGDWETVLWVINKCAPNL